MARYLPKKRPLGPKEHKRQIRNRIGLIILLILLIGFLLSFNFYHQKIAYFTDMSSALLVFMLINLNVMLLIMATLLILRNLIKLIYERRQRRLGFRLKFKLTFAFILVSSLPLLLFFLIANGLLRNSLDYWFTGQYAQALQSSAKVMENLSIQRNQRLIHFAQILAQDFDNKGVGLNQTAFKAESAWFKEALERFLIDGIIWYDQDFNQLSAYFSNETKQKVWEPLPKDRFNRAKPEKPQSFTTSLATARLHRALLAVGPKDKPLYLETTLIDTGQWNKDLAKLQEDLKQHKRTIFLEQPLRTTYTTYLLLFTVLIIFGGTWFGYYLARTIVEPIETVVEGTRRIAKGDLDFQIDIKLDDEIGMLLNSFNSMTQELQTNRKQLALSQEKLLQSNQTLEARNAFVELVLDNIQNGIFSVDSSGFVQAFNPAFLKLFAIKSNKIMGKHHKSLLTKEQNLAFEGLQNMIKHTGVSSASISTHLKFDKRSIHVSMEMFMLQNPSGETPHWLLVINDLTELDRSTKARAWREVARRIAHEIKNPLTPIQLSAQRIRKKYSDLFEDNELLDTCTSTIIKEVNGLKNMVNEFSKFARMPEITPKPADLNQILEDVCNLFTQGLPSKTELSLTKDVAVPEMLLDEAQIKRVFTNLIDNAAAADATKITISTAFSKDLGMVSIEIIDNGCGIPQQMSQRIWDPYVTTKKDGTGLGLAIVQQIVTDHGGFIRHDRVKPQGTKFTLEFPV